MRNAKNSVIVRFDARATADEARGRLKEILDAVEMTALDACERKIAGVCNILQCSSMPVDLIIDGGLVVGSSDKPLIQIGRALRNKIKRRQLASVGPALVVVRVSHMAILRRDDIASIVDSVAQELVQEIACRAVEISAVLVLEEWRDNFNSVQEFFGRNYRAVLNKDEDGSTRLVILVVNPIAKLPLTETELACLVGGHMAW
jgi:hypothetical protein